MATETRADSTDFVYSSFTTNHDITGKTIEVALPPVGQPPVPGSWVTATVLGPSTQIPGTTNWRTDFRIFVGPFGGDIQLAAGEYDWTVRVTDTPERPVRKSGTLLVKPT